MSLSPHAWPKCGTPTSGQSPGLQDTDTGDLTANQSWGHQPFLGHRLPLAPVGPLGHQPQLLRPGWQFSATATWPGSLLSAYLSSALREEKKENSQTWEAPHSKRTLLGKGTEGAGRQGRHTCFLIEILLDRSARR